MPDRRLLCLALAACAGVSHAHADAPDDALARAIGSGDSNQVQSALAHADPNQRLAFGATPLAAAVYAQSPEMVAALLARGAAPNVADNQGLTPLSLACELGNGAIIGRLLDAHADVRALGPDGTGPLAVCARYGPADAVARMLREGAAADAVDTRGQTSLMWAAAAGRVDAMRLLIKAGADVNRVSNGGFTPLLFAIKSRVPAATALLLSVGAATDRRGPENASAAQIAGYQGNFAALAMLVPRGADLTERDREGWQLLHRAVAAGDADLVALLLAKGADPNALTGPSRIKWVTEANFGIPPAPIPPTPPLLLAAEKGHAGVMRQLIAAGADPRFVADDGTNVLLAAAQGGSVEALTLALELAPDANVADARGLTPLHVLLGAPPKPELQAMLRLLAEHGARTDIKNKRGYTAAALAAGSLTDVKTAFIAVFGTEVLAAVTHPENDAEPMPKAAPITRTPATK